MKYILTKLNPINGLILGGILLLLLPFRSIGLLLIAASSIWLMYEAFKKSDPEYSFIQFMKIKSRYFTFFFSIPNWIGAIVYLFIGITYAVQPGGSFIEGLVLTGFVILLMYYFWKKNSLSKK